MTRPNLHEIANTPGAGVAEKALRDAGAWDDSREIDGEQLFKFRIEVIGYDCPEPRKQTVVVTARCEGEARDMVAGQEIFDVIESMNIASIRRAQP